MPIIHNLEMFCISQQFLIHNNRKLGVINTSQLCPMYGINCALGKHAAFILSIAGDMFPAGDGEKLGHQERGGEGQALQKHE